MASKVISLNLPSLLRQCSKPQRVFPLPASHMVFPLLLLDLLVACAHSLSAEPDSLPLPCCLVRDQVLSALPLIHECCHLLFSNSPTIIQVQVLQHFTWNNDGLSPLSVSPHSFFLSTNCYQSTESGLATAKNSGFNVQPLKKAKEMIGLPRLPKALTIQEVKNWTKHTNN